MFGISFTELMLVAAVALLVVGPHKLPAMLGTIGRWMHKLRRLTTEMRQQTGIDEILREEGLQGGLNELRGLVRGGGFPAGGPAPRGTVQRPSLDISREYPPEGADSGGALADDLVEEPSAPSGRNSSVRDENARDSSAQDENDVPTGVAPTSGLVANDSGPSEQQTLESPQTESVAQQAATATSVTKSGAELGPPRPQAPAITRDKPSDERT